MLKYLLVCLSVISCQITAVLANDICMNYKEIAYEAMLIRQGGESAEFVLQEVEETLNLHKADEEIRNNIINIVNNAYTYPYEKDINKASIVITAFAENTYKYCAQTQIFRESYETQQ